MNSLDLNTTFNVVNHKAFIFKLRKSSVGDS